MTNKVLFLTLRVFSATGGIEKVCRIFTKALTDISASDAGMQVKVLSMYDKAGDTDAKYISAPDFSGFGAARIPFIINALWQAASSKVIIVSHINLLSVGVLAKILFRNKKLLLFAHGIEVWQPLSFIRKKMIDKCDTILAVSNFTKSKLIDKSGIAGDKITVLNNCLDPYLPVPLLSKDARLMAKYGLGQNDIVLLTLTRLSSKELYKGYDHILNSLGSLKIKYPGIRYLIAGKYDESEKKRLEEIIEKQQLGRVVIFTGYVPDEELAALFSMADAFVMPSKKEGFGIVFIEAMYYGLPVMAGNKDGSVDALLNGQLGLLVDCDNQQEISDGIEKLIMNREQYKPDPVLLNRHFSFSAYKEKCTALLMKGSKKDQ